MKNRWVMNRIGLNGYWWFHNLEIEMSEDGNLLINGGNATGKTNTLAAIITPLLDGDTSATRMDAFGAKGKKLRDYVLGVGDSAQESGTCYVFAEFINRTTDEMKTLMMGVYDHKTRDSPQKHFWIITDGTRMTIDVPVYTEYKLGNQDAKSPVMISQMKSTLAGSSEYYTRAEDYAAAVNRHFYGFAAQDEFKKMIEGLLLIRKSKLNETNNHNAILQNLSDSLQTIDEDVVSGIAEYCRSIEELEVRLKNNRDDFEEIRKIKKAYEVLQKSTLAERAKIFRAEKSGLKKIEKTLEELSKNKRTVEGELEEKTLERDLFTKTYDDAMNFLALDGIKGLRDLPAQRGELEKRKGSTARRIQQDGQGLITLENQREDLEQTMDDLSYGAEEKKKRVIKLARETLAAAAQVSMNTLDIQDLQGRPEVPFNDKMAEAEARSELEKFKRAKEILEESEKMKEKAEEKEREYEAKLSALKATMKAKEESGAKVFDLVGELVSDIHRWEKENGAFVIENEEDKRKLIQAASMMNEKGAAMPLAAALNQAYLTLHNGLIRGKNRLEEEIRQGEEKILGFETQIREMREHGEVLLKRPETVVLHRERLKSKGLPHIELYKAFQFKENVRPDMRRTIEYALASAGLLDILIVPEHYRREFLDSPKEESDLFVMIGGEEPLSERESLGKYLMPEEGAVDLSLIGQADRFLNSIGVSDRSTHYIGEDGTFRLGQVSGVVDQGYEPLLIGETTRLAHLEKLIGDLTQAITLETAALERTFGKIRELDRRLSMLDKEKEGFPDFEELEREKIRLEDTERMMDQLTKESQQAKSEFEQFFLTSKVLITQAKTLLNNRSMMYTSSGAAAAMELINEIMHHIRELSYEQKTMLDMLRSHEKAGFDIIDKKKRIGDTRDRIYIDQKELDQIESQLSAIMEILDSCEDQENLEKIRVCEEIIGSYSERNLSISNKITEISRSLERILALIEEQNEGKAITGEKKRVAEEMLLKVMELYKIRESLEETMELAETLIRKSDGQGFEKVFQESKDRLNGEFRFEAGYENYYEYQGDKEEVGLLADTARILICKASLPLQATRKNLSPGELYDAINGDILFMEDAITQKSDAMFREISNSKATRAIFEKYRQSKVYVDELRGEISSREMAGGLRLFLEWEKNEAFTGGEVTVKELIQFMTDAAKEKEFSRSIRQYIQYKIDQEKTMAKDEARDVNFERAVFDALDYRKWFSFKIFYEKDGESKTELTPANYNVLSGGMKSTISYAPLISSMRLLMTKAKPGAPRLVALDEAFAGVDLEGADMMFEYLESLDFSYIMTSEKLTGLYPAISNISIVTYDKDVKAREITTLKYYWSRGKQYAFPGSISEIIETETKEARE